MPSLAQRYRPTTFRELVGQLHAAQSLKNAIEYGQIAHAYLFHGSRGVGKTTTARILARCLNCVNGPTTEPCGQCDECLAIQGGYSQDVVEMDAASNRGIENIRNLRENARFAPIRAKYKIYIIDEVHMLTAEAFNALLKTLEEPPSHVVFILATTELQKVPETIISRCQTYTFRKFSIPEILQRLKQVLEKEGFSYEEAALSIVAQRAEGSMRDALSLLEQLIAFSGKEKLTQEKATLVFGLAKTQTLFSFIEAIVKKDLPTQLKIIHEIYQEGLNLKRFVWDCLVLLKDISLESIGVQNLVQGGDFAQVAQNWDKQEILAAFYHLYQLYSHWAHFQIQKSQEVRITLEMALLELHLKLEAPSLSQILSRLSKLAHAIETGKEYTEEKPMPAASNLPKQEKKESPKEDIQHLLARELLAEEKNLPPEERLFP